MKDKEVKNKVNESFTKVSPDDFGSVKTTCGGQTIERGGVAVKTAKHNGLFWKLATAFLALALVAMAVLSMVMFIPGRAVAATVSLDVNPSIQIQVNSDERVLSVTPMNKDGEIIIGDMDLKGAQLQVAVNAVIGSMLRNGYLSDIANSVLVSVDSNKQDLYNKVVETVTSEITLRLKENDLDASVLSQWIKTNDKASQIARDYGISVGKAQLICKILEQNNTYSVDQLALLTINELNLILANYNLPATDDGITQNGSAASDKKYIGEQEAMTKALEKLGEIVGAEVTETDLTRKEIKLDYDDGLMVYEVEVVYNGREYEFEVNAIDGTVVLEDDKNVGGGTSRPVQPSDAVTEEAAKQAAFDKVGVTDESLVSGYFCERDDDDFEIEFVYDSKKYEVDVTLGGIVKSVKWRPISNTATTNSFLDEICAQKNLDKSKVSNFKVEKDDDLRGGKEVYEVEFDYLDGGRRYECECKITADGTIYDWEQEIDD